MGIIHGLFFRGLANFTTHIVQSLWYVLPQSKLSEDHKAYMMGQHFVDVSLPACPCERQNKYGG